MGVGYSYTSNSGKVRYKVYNKLPIKLNQLQIISLQGGSSTQFAYTRILNQGGLREKIIRGVVALRPLEDSIHQGVYNPPPPPPPTQLFKRKICTYQTPSSFQQKVQ